MKENKQFCMSIHTITYLNFHKNRLCTSNEIAESINTNPVVVRRILDKLKKANIVGVKRGIGGAYLKKEIKDISFLDIYKLSSPKTVFALNNKLNETCPISTNLNGSLNDVLSKIDKIIEEELSKHTLKEVSEYINKKEQ